MVSEAFAAELERFRLALRREIEESGGGAEVSLSTRIELGDICGALEKFGVGKRPSSGSPDPEGSRRPKRLRPAHEEEAPGEHGYIDVMMNDDLRRLVEAHQLRPNKNKAGLFGLYNEIRATSNRSVEHDLFPFLKSFEVSFGSMVHPNRSFKTDWSVTEQDLRSVIDKHLVPILFSSPFKESVLSVLKTNTSPWVQKKDIGHRYLEGYAGQRFEDIIRVALDDGAVPQGLYTPQYLIRDHLGKTDHVLVRTLLSVLDFIQRVYYVRMCKSLLRFPQGLTVEGLLRTLLSIVDDIVHNHAKEESTMTDLIQETRENFKQFKPSRATEVVDATKFLTGEHLEFRKWDEDISDRGQSRYG